MSLSDFFKFSNIDITAETHLSLPSLKSLVSCFEIDYNTDCSSEMLLDSNVDLKVSLVGIHHVCVCVLQESEDAVKALAKEKDMLEREKWDLRRQTKEATEQANILRSQMDMKENRVKELEAELTMVSQPARGHSHNIGKLTQAQWCHFSPIIWYLWHKCKQGVGLQSCRCIHISSNRHSKLLCYISSSLPSLKALILSPG